MNRIYKGIITVLCILPVFTLQSLYAEQPNVLMMSEDSDRDSVPRDSRVFRRVISAIQNQMVDEGFSVYDETLVTLDLNKQTYTRRGRAEILDIASSIEAPPIDVVVNFVIYTTVLDGRYRDKLRIRVEGEILHVKSGKYLGNFEQVSPRSWNIKSKCARNRDCVLEMVGDKTRLIANDVGAVLAEKLAWMVTGGSGEVGKVPNQLETAYEVIFDGFSPDEVMVMEEYLVKFTGYLAHRYIYNSIRRAEIWYEGTTSSSRMNRNINKMLAMMDLRGSTQFSANKITVQKITLRNTKKPIKDGDW